MFLSIHVKISFVETFYHSVVFKIFLAKPETDRITYMCVQTFNFKEEIRFKREVDLSLLKQNLEVPGYCAKQ